MPGIQGLKNYFLICNLKTKCWGNDFDRQSFSLPVAEVQISHPRSGAGPYCAANEHGLPEMANRQRGLTSYRMSWARASGNAERAFKHTHGSVHEYSLRVSATPLGRLTSESAQYARAHQKDSESVRVTSWLRFLKTRTRESALSPFLSKLLLSKEINKTE